VLRRLASIGRLIHFARRGTGLSDPVPLDRLPDFETQIGDVIAVLDAAGSERPAVVGVNDGTLVAILLAAARPERVGPLVLFTPTARHVVGNGSPEIEEVVRIISSDPDDSGIGWLAPSRLDDPAFERELSKLQRYSVRPGAMGHYYRQTLSSDVNDVLLTIQAPSLVMNRTANNVVPCAPSRLVADAIPGARFVELPGTDHLIYSQDIDRASAAAAPEPVTIAADNTSVASPRAIKQLGVAGVEARTFHDVRDLAGSPSLIREQAGQLRPRADPELPVDAAEMELDGPRTEEQLTPPRDSSCLDHSEGDLLQLLRCESFRKAEPCGMGASPHRAAGVPAPSLRPSAGVHPNERGRRATARRPGHPLASRPMRITLTP
jgi:pimeloyl-ACP methyl ester carboxylesterase